MSQKQFHILIVDDDDTFRGILYDFLVQTYCVDTACTGFEALDRLAQQSYDLVISDINMPGMSGVELLHRVRQTNPGIKTFLVTSYNIDTCILLAQQYDFSSIVPKTEPFNYGEFAILVRGILTENIFGLEQYLQNGHILGRYTIRSSVEGREVRHELVDLLAQRFEGAADMNLLLDEAITNAIYHAPRCEDGSQKYREFTEVYLEPSEYVQVSCGFDKEKYAVSVSDMQGKLRKETVLERLARHAAGEGILDESGRGLHMSRLFADRMFVNIRPNVRTEIILMNYILKKFQGSKPLYINEVT